MCKEVSVYMTFIRYNGSAETLQFCIRQQGLPYLFGIAKIDNDLIDLCVLIQKMFVYKQEQNTSDRLVPADLSINRTLV